MNSLADLQIISTLQKGQTFSPISRQNIDHNSWSCTLWRSYNKENRKSTISYIRERFMEVLDYYHLNKNSEILITLDEALIGFQNLKETYKGDYAIIGEINSVLEEVKYKLRSIKEVEEILKKAPTSNKESEIIQHETANFESIFETGNPTINSGSSDYCVEKTVVVSDFELKNSQKEEIKIEINDSQQKEIQIEINDSQQKETQFKTNDFQQKEIQIEINDSQQKETQFKTIDTPQKEETQSKTIDMRYNVDEIENELKKHDNTKNKKNQSKEENEASSENIDLSDFGMSEYEGDDFNAEILKKIYRSVRENFITFISETKISVDKHLLVCISVLLMKMLNMNSNN